MIEDADAKPIAATEAALLYDLLGLQAPAQAALELPIFRGGVVFGDEHHRKTKLGHATKYEVRIRRDASGKIAPPE